MFFREDVRVYAKKRIFTERGEKENHPLNY